MSLIDNVKYTFLVEVELNDHENYRRKVVNMIVLFSNRPYNGVVT